MNSTVLIIGGGLVGLSAALTLREQGVHVILIEKHLASSSHPRAIGFTPRTIEIFRPSGLADQIPQVGVDQSHRPKRVTVDTVAGSWNQVTEWTQKPSNAPTGNNSPGVHQKPPPVVEHSPVRGAGFSQDLLEPLIRAKALEAGADLRLGVELIRLEQDENGVTAHVRQRTAAPPSAQSPSGIQEGTEYSIQGCYAIAADGHRSRIRESLGIGRSGRGLIKVLRSVLFRTESRKELDQYLANGISQFQIEQPGFSAFMTTYNDGRWVLMFNDDVERDEEELKKCVLKAIGRELKIEILATGRWELSAQIAETFHKGRIFLAGDAAHTLPPTRGGYGANTGIEDVHNLSWKIAAVLSGISHPLLLSTYDSERRPIAWLRHQQTFARPDYARDAINGAAGDGTIYDDVGMEFGQLYRSAALLVAQSSEEKQRVTKLPAAATPDEWAGQEGTRAPHVWIHKNQFVLPHLVRKSEENRISTLDLFGKVWVIFTEHEHDKWAAALTLLKKKHEHFPITQFSFGSDVVPVEPHGVDHLGSVFGLKSGGGGAVLVRPDGYIAWNSRVVPEQIESALFNIVAKVAFLEK